MLLVRTIATALLVGLAAAGCRAPTSARPPALDGPAVAADLARSPQWALVTDHLERVYGCSPIEPAGWVQRFGTELGGTTRAEVTFQSLDCPMHRVTLTGLRVEGADELAVSATLSTPWDAELTEDRVLVIDDDGELHDVLRADVERDLIDAVAHLESLAADTGSSREGLVIAALTPDQIRLATTACQRLTGVGAAACPAGGCNGCDCMSDANQCAGYLINQVVVQADVFWAQQCLAARELLPGPAGPARRYCSDGRTSGCVDDTMVTVTRADGSTHTCANPASYDRDILDTSQIAALNQAVVDLMRTPDEETQAIRDLASLVGTISSFVPYVGLLGEVGETASRIWGHLGDAVGLANEMSTLLGVDRSNFDRFLEAYESETWGLAGAQYYCWRHRRDAYTSTTPGTIRPPRCAPGGETRADPVLRCGLDRDQVYADIGVDPRNLNDGVPDEISTFRTYCLDRGTRMIRWDDGDWYYQAPDDDYLHGLIPYGYASPDVPFFCCEADVRVSWPNYDDEDDFPNASDEFRWARSVPADWRGFGCAFFTGAAAAGSVPAGVDIRSGTGPWGEMCTWSPYTTPADGAATGSDALTLPVGTWLR